MTSTGEQHQTQIRSFFAENLFDLNMLICSGSLNDQALGECHQILQFLQHRRVSNTMMSVCGETNICQLSASILL